MGIRAIQRITGLHQETILNILETAGQKADAYLDAKIRNVTADAIQADEIHSFVFSKQRNTDANDLERGDQFTFLSVDHRSKLIVNWLVGKRTAENADQFLGDLKARVTSRIQLTTDNWKVYSGFVGSVRRVFGNDVNYATEMKYFGKRENFLPLHRKPKHGHCHNLPRRAHKPFGAHFYSQVHPLHARLFKEAGKLAARGCAVCLAFQLLPETLRTRIHACFRGWCCA